MLGLGTQGQPRSDAGQERPVRRTGGATEAALTRRLGRYRTGLHHAGAVGTRLADNRSGSWLVQYRSTPLVITLPRLFALVSLKPRNEDELQNWGEIIL